MLFKLISDNKIINEGAFKCEEDVQGLQGQQVQPEDLHPLQGKPPPQTAPTLQHHQTTPLTTPSPPATSAHPARTAQNSYLRRIIRDDSLNDTHTQSQSHTITTIQPF